MKWTFLALFLWRLFCFYLPFPLRNPTCWPITSASYQRVPAAKRHKGTWDQHTKYLIIYLHTTDGDDNDLDPPHRTRYVYHIIIGSNKLLGQLQLLSHAGPSHLSTPTFWPQSQAAFGRPWYFSFGRILRATWNSLSRHLTPNQSG